MNEKPKILMLNYLFPPLGGGGGVAARTVAKGLVRAGYDVDYITTWTEGLPYFEVVDGISVYRVRVFGSRKSFPAPLTSLFLYPLCAFWKGFTLCQKKRYSCINSQFVLPAGLLGFILSKLFSVKHIISIHGGDIYDPTRKRSPHRHPVLRSLIRFLLNHADRIIAQSYNTKENCLQYYRPRREITIIPLPYESQPFSPISKQELVLPEEKKYIIGIGMLVKRKAFDVFIKALANLDDNVHGILIGEGPEIDDLTTLAGELGVTSRIHFLGHIDGERKFQYLAQSDVFVLSSVHEGFGIVLQEALQVGLPIVATNHGGQVDIVVDGEQGFLVPPENPELLADNIRSILTSDDLASRMRNNAVTSLKRYDLELLTQAFIRHL